MTETPPKTTVADELPIEWLEIDGLVDWPDNPRKNDDVSDLVVSLEENGWEKNVVVWRVPEGIENVPPDLADVVAPGAVVVVAGHRTLAAAKELGLVNAPCRDGGWTDFHRAAAFNVLDNRSSEKGEWDDSKLRVSLERIPEELARLTAFSPREIQKIKSGIPVSVIAFMGDAPPPAPVAPGVDIDEGELDVPAPMFKLILCFQGEADWREMCRRAGLKLRDVSKSSASLEADEFLAQLRELEPESSEE